MLSLSKIIFLSLFYPYAYASMSDESRFSIDHFDLIDVHFSLLFWDITGILVSFRTSYACNAFKVLNEDSLSFFHDYFSICLASQFFRIKFIFGQFSLINKDTSFPSECFQSDLISSELASKKITLNPVSFLETKSRPNSNFKCCLGVQTTERKKLNGLKEEN